MNYNGKKLLMLGGAYAQIPAIEQAKKDGYYVITCDYLPENPGHKISDYYENISTTDKDKILEFAREKGIHGISAFASDPSAQTAAYVADKMKLQGPGLDAVQILSEKDRFRKFQKDQGYFFPNFISVSQKENTELKPEDIKFPCYVKPVDASGSKGVKKVSTFGDLERAISDAMAVSRNKRVIIEEEISSPYDQIHGDGFAEEGELVFLELGDQHFKGSVPIGTACPSRISPEIIERAKEEVANLIKAVGFSTGAINVEIRIGQSGEIYILEIGPRSGGNYIPQLMEAVTGFDETKACIDACMGNSIQLEEERKQSNMVFQYIIGSDRDGAFQSVELSEYAKKNLLQIYIHKKPGEFIKKYESSSNVVGVALIRADSREELDGLVENIAQHVIVLVEE